MSWERRDESDTPDSAARRFVDDRGRSWTGMITSGSRGGGEEHAEVIFVCEDNASEPKRVARLDEPPARATERWQEMGDDSLREVFDRSSPA